MSNTDEKDKLPPDSPAEPAHKKPLPEVSPPVEALSGEASPFLSALFPRPEYTPVPRPPLKTSPRKTVFFGESEVAALEEEFQAVSTPKPPVIHSQRIATVAHASAPLPTPTPEALNAQASHAPANSLEPFSLSSKTSATSSGVLGISSDSLLSDEDLGEVSDPSETLSSLLDEVFSDGLPGFADEMFPPQSMPPVAQPPPSPEETLKTTPPWETYVALGARPTQTQFPSAVPSDASFSPSASPDFSIQPSVRVFEGFSDARTEEITLEIPEPIEIPAAAKPSRKLPAIELPATELPSTGPFATEFPSSGLFETELPSTEPFATEFPSSGLFETEPPSTGPFATELPSAGLFETEPPSAGPFAMEPPSTGPFATELSSAGLFETEPPSTGPFATELSSAGLFAMERPATEATETQVSAEIPAPSEGTASLSALEEKIALAKKETAAILSTAGPTVGPIFQLSTPPRFVDPLKPPAPAAAPIFHPLEKTHEAVPAPLPSLVGAFLVDTVLLCAASLGVLWAAKTFTEPSQASAWQVLGPAGVALLALLAAAYAIFFAVAWEGATPGRKLFGLKLVNKEGHAIGFFRAFARGLFSLLSFGLALAGFWWAFVDKRRQTFHDKCTGTFVVRLQPKQ